MISAKKLWVTSETLLKLCHGNMKHDSHQQCLIVHGLLLSKNQFPNVLHKNTKLMQSLQSFWEFYLLYHCHITLTGKIKLIFKKRCGEKTKLLVGEY